MSSRPSAARTSAARTTKKSSAPVAAIEEKNPDLIVERNLGIIAQRCLYWWPRLPACVRSWYEVEDLISEVALHVHRKREKYNPERAKETTWVWWVAQNRCRSAVTYWNASGRLSLLSASADPELLAILPAPGRERLMASVTAVESVIASASANAREALAAAFEGRVTKRREIDPKTLVDLQSTARNCGATATDFVTVWGACWSKA